MKNMGISGLYIILSKNKTVFIYTFDGKKYVTSNVPWRKNDILIKICL